MATKAGRAAKSRKTATGPKRPTDYKALKGRKHTVRKTAGAQKTLKIIFSGISTLWPGPSRNGAAPPDKAFVIMAANTPNNTGGDQQTTDWGTPIPPHTPFVHVAASFLTSPPPPSTQVARGNDSDYIYFFRDARVRVVGAQPTAPIKYNVGDNPLDERPGSSDVAAADDIRWLADIRDIVSKPSLKNTADPTGKTEPNDDVAAVVNLDGGTLSASFPCDSVQPKTFADQAGHVVPGLRRVLATEFILETTYSADTASVTLQFDPLRRGAPVTGPGKLVLKWPDGESSLVVRMGNDTEDEVPRLNTRDRCEPPRQATGPLLKPRDDDFDLHYNLLQLPGGVRPLPQNDPHQTRFDGCKPATT